MSRPTLKRTRPKPKAVLRLPDLDQAKTAVLNSLTSADAQRGYRHAIDEFVEWYCSEPRLSFNRTVVLRYRLHLEGRKLAPGTINLRLGAVRRLAYEAADCGLLSPDLAAGIRRVKGVKKIGVRLGNWLTAEQSQRLWQAPNGERLKEKRDRALLAVLLACGLRRHEAVDLNFGHIQQREEHWAIIDLKGDVGHQDGTDYLVMESLEGETLEERLRRGSAPLEHVLAIGMEICEALEYAHERGIVHRDLKPANVKVTPEGAVKLLDFGLATALEGEVASADIASSPTLTRMATRDGIILGTAAYMSPEQARGKAADRRSDIWSFGCVFYEMLAGKMAFGSETVTDTLASVIKSSAAVALGLRPERLFSSSVRQPAPAWIALAAVTKKRDSDHRTRRARERFNYR